MAIPKSQEIWAKENTIQVSIRINRNQDPELYEMLKSCQGSKANVIRELILSSPLLQQRGK